MRWFKRLSMQAPRSERRRHFGGRRLYLRLWLAVLASLLAFAVAVGLLGRLWWHDEDNKLTGWVVIADELLPASAAATYWQGTLDRLAVASGASFALYAADGRPIAAAGRVLAPPPAALFEPDEPHEANERVIRWHEGVGRASWMLGLADGRHLVVADVWGGARRRGLIGFIFALSLIAIAVGVGAYPVVRRLTRRLENLQQTVDAFGAGELTQRATVGGRDEIAALADSFNRSAERIEALLRANRSLLANASHELRSPLARIRMAIELLGPEPGSDPRAIAAAQEVRRNIVELDELVEELLLASRLDAGDDANASLDPPATIDWLALLAEECARIDGPIEFDVAAALPDWQGDARLIRRLVRNLLENARRYGAGQPIDVRLQNLPSADSAPAQLRLQVLDRGPGVAPDERERIFEPFYRVRGASERSGSVGLGLALVRQIARRHGGQVRCLERPGGGSCFELLLPWRGSQHGS